MPGYANPQNLNRYSYVTNNPLRYTDPSGHIRVDNEGGGGKKGCSDPRYCENGKMKSEEELAKMRNRKKGGRGGSRGELTLLITNFADGGRLDPWDGPGIIDPGEWEGLLENVGDDVHSFSTGWYDTPFFNNYFYSGTGCFGGERDCYDRSELNYIGEGEALAALGLSKEATHNVVWTWKNKGNIVWCALGVECSFREPSQGTIAMTDIGWDYYHEHYSSPSHSLDTFTIVPPGIATSILR